MSIPCSPARATRRSRPHAEARTPDGAYPSTAPRHAAAAVEPIESRVLYSTTLAAAADAYVRDGAYAMTNYGSAAELVAKGSTVADNTRRAYLKFDAASLSNGVGSAKLRLFGASSATLPAAAALAAYGVPNTTWSESGINWGNKPALAGGALDTESVSGTTGQWYEWDVTSYVKSKVEAGHRAVTLAIEPTTFSTGNPIATFNSDEAAANRPQLVVTPAMRATNVVTSARFGEVKVTWDAAPGATRYDVYRSTTAGQLGTAVANDVTATNWVDNAVSTTASTTYYYTVAAEASVAGDPGIAVPATPPLVTNTMTHTTGWALPYVLGPSDSMGGIAALPQFNSPSGAYQLKSAWWQFRGVQLRYGAEFAGGGVNLTASANSSPHVAGGAMGISTIVAAGSNVIPAYDTQGSSKVGDVTGPGYYQIALRVATSPAGGMPSGSVSGFYIGTSSITYTFE